MEDVVVYGYLTPLRVKIILALALTDAVVRDKDITEVRSAFLSFDTAILTTHVRSSKLYI